MARRLRIITGLAGILVLSLSACGQTQEATGVRNVAPAHCIQPVVQPDSEHPSGYATWIHTCSEITTLIVGGFGGTQIVYPSPDGLRLSNWYPYSAPDDPRHRITERAPSDRLVIGFGFDGSEIEWLRLHRLDSGAIELRYSTATSVEPSSQECIKTALETSLRSYFVLSSACDDTNLVAMYPRRLATTALQFFNRSTSNRVDANVVSFDEYNMVVGDSDGNPTERLTGQVTDGVLNATAWKYSQPTVEIMEGTEPVSAPPAETQSTTPATGTPADATLPAASDAPKDGGSTQSSDQTPREYTAQEFKEAVSRLNELCTDLKATISPAGPVKSTEMVTVTPEFGCDQALLPKGLELNAMVTFVDQKSGSAEGTGIILNGPVRRAMKRLAPGTWRVDISVFAAAQVDGNFVRENLRPGASSTVEVVRDDSFVNCSGDDLTWDGEMLRSECLTKNNVTPLVSRLLTKAATLDELKRKSDGFPLAVSGDYEVFLVGIPQNEGYQVKALVLCSVACTATKFGFSGAEVVASEGSYTARFTEDCGESLSFSWGRKVNERMVVFDNNDDDVATRSLVNNPGTDATVSGFNEAGLPVKGAEIKATPPAGWNVLVVAANCGGSLVFSLHEIPAAAGTGSGSTPTSAAPAPADTEPAERESIARIVSPVIETPAASMSGQPVTITDDTEFISIKGTDVADAGYVSVKASIDNEKPVVIPAIGVARIPVPRDSKVLKVTYTKPDGTKVEVTKPIVNAQSVVASRSSGTSVTTIAIVLLVILGVGAGLMTARRRARHGTN